MNRLELTLVESLSTIVQVSPHDSGLEIVDRVAVMVTKGDIRSAVFEDARQSD